MASQIQILGTEREESADLVSVHPDSLIQYVAFPRTASHGG